MQITGQNQQVLNSMQQQLLKQDSKMTDSVNKLQGSVIDKQKDIVINIGAYGMSGQ